MPFTFTPVDDLPGLVLVEPRRFDDDRGWFKETYKASAFAEAGIDATFVQDNHSFSARKGTLRGLHYQREPKAQGKLVRCTRGRVLDVAVDLRQGSPTYADWWSLELAGDTPKQLWVPPGFAHGFCTLAPDSEVQYKVTAEYDPDLDSGFAWDDPDVGVDWPVEDPILSEADRQAPPLAEADANFEHSEP